MVSSIARLRVLIVDDHPVFCQGLRRILESVSDIEVIGMARDGEEALDMARESTPDVILMDINLPTMNGMQVTRLIKAELPNIAVIMLTAYGTPQSAIEALKLGAYDHLAKPFNNETLLEMIKKALE